MRKYKLRPEAIEEGTLISADNDLRESLVVLYDDVTAKKTIL
jgi:hypothetical protein